MRFGSILGLGAALVLTGLHVASPSVADRAVPRERGLAPNDSGPVIDTTPESKRARRRRLAKARSA